MTTASRVRPLPRWRALLRDLRDAVRGTEVDYTQGSLGRAILLLAVPMVLGSEALAGYTIAVRIFIFTLLPSWGVSNAAATLVGQNLGARQPERAERAVWITGWANMAFLIVVTVVYLSFGESLVRIFTSEPGVVAAGAEALRIWSYGYPIFAWAMIMPQAFNGAGDTMTPTKINFFCFWLLEIPLAYLLALQLSIGTTGVYWSVVIAESLAGLVGIVLFRRGKWKQMRV